MAGENAENDVDEKSTATMVPRNMRLKKLQLVTGEQSPMRIKLDRLTFLVRREQREHCILPNRPQTLQG